MISCSYLYKMEKNSTSHLCLCWWLWLWCHHIDYVVLVGLTFHKLMGFVLFQNDWKKIIRLLSYIFFFQVIYCLIISLYVSIHYIYHQRVFVCIWINTNAVIWNDWRLERNVTKCLIRNKRFISNKKYMYISN